MRRRMRRSRFSQAGFGLSKLFDRRKVKRGGPEPKPQADGASSSAGSTNTILPEEGSEPATKCSRTNFNCEASPTTELPLEESEQATRYKRA